MKLKYVFTLLLTIGLVASTFPATAQAAHPPRTVFGAQVNFQPATGYPAMPPYPLTVRKTKFDRHTWCWSARLYDAATNTYGPYNASLTPPILPTEPGLEGGDNCDDPTTYPYAVMFSASRAANLYGTFGPATIISGIKADPAVRRVRLNLPNGSTVHLPLVKGTVLYATNSVLGPVTLTYRLHGVDVTTAPF